MFWDKNEENLVTIYTTDKYDDEIIVNVYSKLNGKNMEKRFHYKEFNNHSNFERIKEYISDNSMIMKGIILLIRTHTNF